MTTVAVAGNVEEVLDKKLSKMNQEIHHEQKVSAKKARLDRSQQFKSKRYEEQHRFLQNTLAELDNAQVELEKAAFESFGSTTSTPNAIAKAM